MNLHSSKPSGRFVTLDYLRGFFIVVIIIDHLWRWPNLLAVFTGQGLLWVSAAEGFVIISGLMIGYIRGYKNRSLPLSVVSKKLLLRALLLYGWFVLATILYSILQWYIPDRNLTPWVPYENQDIPLLVTHAISSAYAHVWVHFLYLYAIFLAISPAALWLLRRGLAWLLIAVSFIVYCAGFLTQIEWMQWQVLFFLPVIVGFYMKDVMRWWNNLVVKKQVGIKAAVLAVTSLTIATSIFFMFIQPNFGINDIFGKEPLTLTRIALGCIWFIGLFFIFQAVQPWLTKWLGWLLEPFGTRSLTAYIVHGLVIAILASIIAPTDSLLTNTLAGIISLLATWALIKLPTVQRFIPR